MLQLHIVEIKQLYLKVLPKRSSPSIFVSRCGETCCYTECHNFQWKCDESISGARMACEIFYYCKGLFKMDV